MTDKNDQTAQKKKKTRLPDDMEAVTLPSQAEIKSKIIKRSLITFVVTAQFILIVWLFLFGPETQKVKELAQQQEQMQQKIARLDQNYNTAEGTLAAGLSTVTQQVDDLLSVVGLQRIPPEDYPQENLINRVQGLESQTQSYGYTPEMVRELENIVISMQSRVDQLDSALMETRNQSAEISSALGGINGKDMSAAAMLLAMTQMRSSLARAEPFEHDLAVLQSFVQDDPELTAALQRLAPYSEKGILTPAGLSGELKTVSNDIITGALRGEDVSVTDRLTAQIGQVVKIEQNGERVIGIKEQRIIDRAQDALDRGDVKGALVELQQLDGEAAKAATPVVDQAVASVVADDIVTLLLTSYLKNWTDGKGNMQAGKTVNPDAACGESPIDFSALYSKFGLSGVQNPQQLNKIMARAHCMMTGQSKDYAGDADYVIDSLWQRSQNAGGIKRQTITAPTLN